MTPRKSLSSEMEQALSELAEARHRVAQARRKLAGLTKPGGPDYLVEKEWRWAHELVRERCDQLLGRRGVLGCGLGFRVCGCERTRTPCMTVFVEKKLPKGKVRKAARLPKTVSIGGRRLPVDVIELGKIERLAVTAGASIGQPDPPSERGTLGVFARDTARGDVVGITAMHVAAPLANFPATNIVSPPFVCPGSAGAPRFGSLRAGTMTGIDAATLELSPAPSQPATVLPGIGRVRGWRPTTFPGDQHATVRLFGATSGFQIGTIMSPATAIPSWSLSSAILADIPTAGGDSGCALIDAQNLVLGFLVGRGGSSLNNMAIFTPASLVLARLGCDIPSA